MFNYFKSKLSCRSDYAAPSQGEVGYKRKRTTVQVDNDSARSGDNERNLWHDKDFDGTSIKYVGIGRHSSDIHNDMSHVIDQLNKLVS